MIGLYAEVSSGFTKGSSYLHTINKFASYSHNIAALGGFWDANLGLSLSHAVAEDWFENGLGRQIKIRSNTQRTAWQGFVNKVVINVGSQTVTKGPLLDIVNRGLATYTPRDFSVYPPVDGATTTTLIDDTIGAASQLAYGILEKSIAAGATTEANALKMRDVFLEQNKWPKTTGDFNISGIGAPISVTLELLGKVHWLTVYPFNNLTPAIITVYTKLLQVLAASPNNVLSTDYSKVETNAYAVNQLEDGNRTAWDIINELLALGNDVNDTRRIFGVYEDDKVVYRTAPTDIKYEYRLTAQHQRVVDYNTKNIVQPWDIRPGYWLHTPDWLVGRIINTTDLYGDPKNKFIENVNFSAPYTVGLTGSPVDKLSQMIAKITYTGGIY